MSTKTAEDKASDQGQSMKKKIAREVKVLNMILKDLEQEERRLNTALHEKDYSKSARKHVRAQQFDIRNKINNFRFLKGYLEDLLEYD